MSNYNEIIKKLLLLSISTVLLHTDIKHSVTAADTVSHRRGYRRHDIPESAVGLVIVYLLVVGRRSPISSCSSAVG